jgi:hypothetical protein
MDVLNKFFESQKQKLVNRKISRKTGESGSPGSIQGKPVYLE